MNVKGKRLLILGAGRGQTGLYKAARELGMVTIAGTMLGGNPPCLALADEICEVDISDPIAVAEKAKNYNLDGVATCCLDTGIAALGNTCDTLGLTGLKYESAQMCNDKLKMKRAFMEHGVSTAKFYEVSSEEELSSAMEKLELPVIIKATDLQGSRGIYISRTREEAFEGFRNAMELTRRSYCIVEEFIEGEEFGAQSFVYNGEVLYVMPHGDETYMSHTAVPVGHSVPLECSDDVRKQTEDVVKKAIAALGLNNCAVNVDLILKNGKVYMIELTGRVGANCLPELVEINFGIEYYKMIAVMAVGENPLEFWEKRNDYESAGLAKMVFSTDKAGVLKEELSYTGEWTDDIREITFFKHVGDEIRVFENSNDCIGQIIVKGETLDKCKEKVEAIVKDIKMVL